ncbi:MAG: helix-turn-helix domain-containing protein [Candidatus Izemoplasmataceae bacterium]
MFKEESTRLYKDQPVTLARDYLKEYRNKMGYSAERLSRELDVSAVYYRQIEGGQRGKKLPIELVIKLIILLNVDPLDFLKAEASYLSAYEDLNGIKKLNKVRW